MSVTTTVAQSALSREERQSTSLVGITTAGTRALASQFFTFYLRIPVKLFRPTRIDYMALPRAINPTYHSKPWNFFTHSSPALIAHAVREHGWGFIPHNILPPLIANSAVGVALYTSYLSSLAILRDDNGHYGLRQTLISGAVAGGVQSLAAAPIDAIVTRFNVSEMIQSDHKALWQYGWTKLKEIGPHGVFSGFAVSLLKESLSFALYFATFEEIKGSWYRKFVQHFYTNKERDPGRFVFPSFVLLAGFTATFSLQAAHYPLGKIQKLHLIRLEALDLSNRLNHKPSWRLYFRAYQKTLRQMNKLRVRDAQGSWFRWLYGGFFRSTLMAIPSTSIGLIVFEIMRLRYNAAEPPAFRVDESYLE